MCPYDIIEILHLLMILHVDSKSVRDTASTSLSHHKPSIHVLRPFPAKC